MYQNRKSKDRAKRCLPVLAISLVYFGPALFNARAEPSWARKYNAECSLCHTIYPRLNRMGYDFKRLGYRMPREIQSRTNAAQGKSDAPPVQTDHTPVTIAPTGYKPKPVTKDAEVGRALYDKLNCATCHTIGGGGGKIGPPLDGIGARRDAAFMTGHLTNPQEHATKYPELHGGKPSIMPPTNATPEQTRQLVAYLMTLPEPAGGFVVDPHAHGPLPVQGAGSPSGTALATESSHAGEKVYFDLGCAGCHAIGGTGGQFGPALDGIASRRTREFVAAHVTNPKLHTHRFPNEHTGESLMPPTKATPDQIGEIADFLMTIHADAQNIEALHHTRIEDYVALLYAPSVAIDNASGKTSSTFDKRSLAIYAAGPLGRNFSFFVQPTPASDQPGFGNKFEMAQGLFNTGGTRNFLQVRFGQMFNLRNAGFGGTDRGLTDTLPLIFEASNGFNPAALGRGLSLEYTLRGTTTF